jgi:hypothetical protein
MRTMARIVLVAARAIVAIAWSVFSSHAIASSDSDKSEIVALNQHIAAAISKKDLNAVMAFYVNDKDMVFFEDTIPFQYKGISEVRKYIQGCKVFPKNSTIVGSGKSCRTIRSIGPRHAASAGRKRSISTCKETKKFCGLHRILGWHSVKVQLVDRRQNFRLSPSFNEFLLLYA